MGDSFNIATFFHRLSMEFPLYVKWTDDVGGCYEPNYEERK